MLALSLHVKHGPNSSGCDEHWRKTREQRRVIDPLGSLLGGCQRSWGEEGGVGEGVRGRRRVPDYVPRWVIQPKHSLNHSPTEEAT